MKSLTYIPLILMILLPDLILGQRFTRSDYIESYKDIAITEMKRTGIPASITLAQGILESDCGNSQLAKKSNNHFGIKCHNDWTGGKVYHDDDRKGECFRQYKSANESFVDHSDFLTGRQRYSELFELEPTDYKGWAHGLKKAGYATEPQYAHRLIKIIEEEELWIYDNGAVKGSSKAGKTAKKSTKTTRKSSDFVISPFNSHTIKYNNGVRYVDVAEGDSFDAIATEFGLQQWEIPKYNDLEKGADIKNYSRLYIQRKRNKAHRNHESHTVRANETLWDISHKYGVKISKLRFYNHLGKNMDVEEGETINLRRKKPL